VQITPHVYRHGFRALLILLLAVSGLKAAAIDFSGAAPSLRETILTLETLAASPYAGQARPAPAPAVSGLRTYDFKTLYAALGYPAPAYFGASEEATQSLESYTSKQDAFYEEINGYLRFYPEPYDWYGTGPEDARNIVADIDSIFARAPALPADLVMFRGLSLKFRGNKPYEVNEEFTDKGYVSTSTSFKVARYFAVGKEKAGDAEARKAVFAIYNNRPGERGILIDQDEDEVILKHGMKFRVMGKRATDEKYDLYLVQACAGPCDASLRADARVFWENFKVK